MNKQFDFLVFIGRFQPFHFGHLAVIEEGLRQAEHLIVLCGSAHQPRNTRNPWSIDEREIMLRSTVSNPDNKRLQFAPLMDVLYNDGCWVRNVQATVQGLVTAQHDILHRTAKVGLIGHSKDQSSYYLNLFPQWGSLTVSNFRGISATPIRESIFGAHPKERPTGLAYLKSDTATAVLPHSVLEYLYRFCDSEAYDHIREEQSFIAKYKLAWHSAPYDPTFVTVDAIVVQSGHILLIERKARPGKGLLALPGGFINSDERLVDACLRELREETRLKVPLPVIKGSIKQQRVFDDPHRSARGRTITHAFYVELEPNDTLPKVKGGDDAKQAMWVPLAELDPATLFEDHYFIIQEMLGA